MGTSTQWAGATQGTRWRAGDRKLDELCAALPDRVDPSDVGRVRAQIAPAVARCGHAYLVGLSRNVQREGPSGPLRQEIVAAGDRIAEAVAATSTQLRDLVVLTASPERDDALAEVTELFLSVMDVGSGAILDSVIRRAVAPAILETLADLKKQRDQATDGEQTSGTTPEASLFCLLYRHFFAQVVAQTVTTVIAAKIRLAVPVLHLVDPAGLIATWIAKRVFSLLPNPCDHAAENGGSLASLGRAVLRETVDRALGVPSSGPEMGVAA